MKKKIICPNCNRNNIVKRGFFKTKVSGKVQRYYCKNCRKKFIPRTAFYRMRNSPKKITLCIDLFYRGISTRKVQEHLKSFYPNNSDHSNILRWIKKYSLISARFTDKLKLQVGKEIQIDEMEYHRKDENNGKGVEKDWFIDSIDTYTRFMVSSKYVKKREQRELKEVLKFAKTKTERQFTIITTDGYTAYEDVVKKVYGYNFRGNKTKVFHNKVTASKGEGFNLFIERLHNSIRERTKIFRGFHGSLESAKAIMKGYEIFYNFIRKHQAMNCCPYELACPDLKLNSNNKWLELIERGYNGI